MTIQELIDKLETIPEQLREKEIVFYDTSRNGLKSTPRTDVSQFYVTGNVMQMYVKEVK